MQPQGEKNRKAVRWISAQIQDNPTEDLGSIVHRAIAHYDLNPKEAEELIIFYRRAKDSD